jgi:hypothetical protein
MLLVAYAEEMGVGPCSVLRLMQGFKKYCSFSREALECQRQMLEFLSIVLWQPPTLHVKTLMLMSNSELPLWLLELYSIVLARAVQTLAGFLSPRGNNNEKGMGTNY